MGGQACLDRFRSSVRCSVCSLFEVHGIWVDEAQRKLMRPLSRNLALMSPVRLFSKLGPVEMMRCCGGHVSRATATRWLARVHESDALELKTRESREEPSTGTQSPGVVPSRSTRAKLLIGMPVITSPGGLRFWLELCGVAKRDDICGEALENLGASVGAGHAVGSGPSGQASAGSKEGPIDEASARARSPPYGDEWFRTTLGRLRGMGHVGVAGVHVMAPGSAPRRRLRELIEDGVFAPSRG